MQPTTNFSNETGFVKTKVVGGSDCPPNTKAACAGGSLSGPVSAAIMNIKPTVPNAAILLKYTTSSMLSRKVSYSTGAIALLISFGAG
jgi:hypothetical protein